MKKLLFLSLISIFVCSCDYNTMPEIPKPLHYETHPAPEPPAPEPEAGGNIPIVFSGAFGDVITTRAGINNGVISWNNGDRILVLWNGGFNFASASADGASAEFSTEVNEADTYWSVYPSSLDAIVNSNGLSVTIPATQYGELDKVNIAVASTDVENKNFVFHNLCGLGSFTLSRNDIAKIVFKGLSDEKLAGEAALSIGDGGIPSITSISSPVDSIVVVPSGKSFAAGTYYFAAAPGALDTGVSFTLTTNSGCTILGKAIATPDVLNRSEISSFGTLDAAGTSDTISLIFDFMGDQLDGWPISTQKANTLEDTDAIYPLDGKDYTFALRFPKTTSTTSYGVYWGASTSSYGNRFIINGKYKYAGLPAVEEYKLVKVNLWQTRVGTSDKTAIPAVAIADDVPEAVLDASSEMSLANGGEPKAWKAGVKAKSLNGPYTYTLSDTAAGTNYYLVLYGTNEWSSSTVGIGKIEVTYEKAD